ncbi:spermatogenesis-associated protein 1 [Grus americana]|uniref:spermatogenesis-associated protein 1 n=1 Tax=Grus americana TaxID=9117 RepID=UPI0024081C8B|nr:spermatogenesis-associated protein 1 [Grus americana]XP_054689175.1 spermatogenesis-associated protein 1 [Grus americana]XP_054689176.1 spermatogenesis-associated protein 1 [Grus americana]
MSFSQTRPRTSQLVELHVFYVPEEVWNFKLNTVPVALTSKFISAGFIRVSPHITLRVLREKLGEYLGGVAVADKFRFLKCIGKKLAVVKAKQETELELESFVPPHALYPELYLLPGVEYFEDVYPLSSSSTQQKHHFNAEANRFGHRSRLSSLPQPKPEKNNPFLESIQSSHQLENQEVHSPVEWGEKDPVPVLYTKHKEDHNKAIQAKQTQFREKDQNGSSGSLFTPSHSNPADWESGKSDMVFQTSQQNGLSQGQNQHHTPKWNDKAKGTAFTLHENHSDEQGQNNQTPQNCIKYRKELTNMENNDYQKDTKLRRDRTQDAGILKIMGDQTTAFVRKTQSLQQYRTSKSIADPGEKLDNQADENKQDHLTCPKEYISCPSPPFMALSVNPAQVPSIQVAKNKMVEQLQQTKKDRRHMEKTREELIKKAKGLLEQNKLRRYHVREEWKKKYFETKKATVSLEDALNKLRQDLELYHRKLLLQLEARDSRKQPNNMADSKNYTIIRITTVQHELDQLRRKLDDTKMKLIIEIKMRKQAATDLQALRAELTQKKIHSALILQSRKSGI